MRQCAVCVTDATGWSLSNPVTGTKDHLIELPQSSRAIPIKSFNPYYHQLELQALISIKYFTYDCNNRIYSIDSIETNMDLGVF